MTDNNIYIKDGEHYIEVDGQLHKLDPLTVAVDELVVEVVGLVPDEKREQAERVREKIGRVLEEAFGKLTATNSKVLNHLWAKVEHETERNDQQDAEIADLKQRGGDG